jgi:hypothetical protein
MQRGAMNIFCKKAMNFFCKKKVDRAAHRRRESAALCRPPPHRAEPQGVPAAVDGIALRELAKADPVAIARLEERATLGKAKRGPSARRVSSIAAAMVAALLIGLYFSDEIAPYVARHAGQQDIFGGSTIGEQVVAQATQLPNQDSQKTDLLALPQQPEADHASAQQPGAQEEVTQVKQVVEAAPVPDARQSLEKEQRAEVLARELAEARRAINGLNLQLRVGAANSAQLLGREREKTAALAQDAAAARQELKASTAQDNRALEEERARGAALASELAKARGEVETNVALLNKARDDAAQFKQTAERMTAELQQERDRAEASSRELARAQRDTGTQVVVSSKTGEEAAQLKQAAENATAELRQSVQQERDRAEALASELARAQRDIETQVALASKTAATEQAAAAGAQGGPEAARLLTRASALLGQGNIGAARIVLERAAEMGSAQGSFMLAETYDPVILSTWGTYGTRGDATKARELYAKAHAGGIREAKDRLNALR